ncbi:hypothetical protein KP509_28G031000 [Ceratopteris richardii]|uniref:acetyl-CoA C-acyltransferase n=2 Tax=Ceratopteris richardii TaxID=49495 RepID=A0A8T2RAW9_CERRI|nr:hypothetical protein KP509_28G031000 [Ceratopteris richardii]
MDHCSSEDNTSYAMETVARRQQVLRNHLFPRGRDDSSASIVLECTSQQSDSYERAADFHDDVVIVSAVRTPICRAVRGKFKDTSAKDLLAVVLKAVLDQNTIEPGEVGDIAVGMVLGPASRKTRDCRMAALEAGFPETVPIRSLNRQCGSGLQAIADVAACIKAGFYDIGIGAGVESMTSDYKYARMGPVNPKAYTNQNAKDCLLPMGLMSENVASIYGISREDQDASAALSHRRASSAWSCGKFNSEVVPVHTKIVDASTGREEAVVVRTDDGVRPNTNMTGLSKLKSAFKNDGSTTAGNSSQVSDGASAVLLMKRSVAVERGIPILGIFRSFAVVGVGPAVNGIGPVYAIPKALKQAGLQLEDISLFEINEAFASQYVYCCKELGLDIEKVNVNGGAMALGHPLGATGTRCAATLLYEMQRRGKSCKYGVISMCIGSGMGAAAVLERGPMINTPLHHRVSA